MRILHVVGARPNFMKAAPVIAALAECDGVSQALVHTGQHYDTNMSEIFFQQLGLPPPDVNLEVGSASHGVQTAQIMIRFDDVVKAERPDWVIVYGDVNSTVAAALVCSKLRIRVAHVEAGLRSFDRTMPEEINRVLTDQVADMLFTPSEDANENLACEGIQADKIRFVGNVMIDTLVRLLPKAELPQIAGLDEPYALVTLHRPSNVDDPETLNSILRTLTDIGQQLQVIFPAHPRTRARMAEFGLAPVDTSRLVLAEPMGYLRFLALQRQATVVITDSGGIQEETTYLGVPCLTMRDNTERPITVALGSNILVGQDMRGLKAHVERILAGEVKSGSVPPLWDGQTSQRIAAVLADEYRARRGLLAGRAERW